MSWFYRVRVARCQYFTPKPDDRIVHVDIDDASLEPGAVGRWPWTRGTLARIISEIGRANPAAIAIDLHLIDPENPDEETTPTTNPAGALGDDAALADCLSKQKNAVLAVTFELPSTGSRTRVQTTAFEELSANLELNFAEFDRSMRQRGVDLEGRDDAQDLYTHTLKLAMRDRINSELRRSPLTDGELRDRLLPHLGPGISAPALTLLKAEAAFFRSRQGVQAFRTRCAHAAIACRGV